MTTKPGLIILLGSGETSPRIRKVYHWLFEQMAAPIRLGIVETPAGFEPNSDKVALHIAEFMKKRLQNFQPDISIIPARKRGTPFSPDEPDILTPLLDSNVILMGPGSPSYAVRQLQNSLAWHTMQAKHRLGTNFIFASAATIACGTWALPVYEIYKVGEDVHWKPGLDIFAAFGLSLVLVPHWNNTDGGAELDTSRCYMGLERHEQLVALLPEPRPTVVGLDEQTALIVDPASGECRVMGVGSVTVVREGQERVFATGQSFEATVLGAFTLLAESAADIPAAVWSRVQAAQTPATASEMAEPEPPPEVMDLLNQRNAARSRKEWALADRLRDQIEALGWKVLDTPQETVLELA